MPQHISPLEDLQPNPFPGTGKNTIRSSGSRSTNKTSTNTAKASTPLHNRERSARTDTQQNAQFVGESVVEPSWGKKSLPKTRNFSQLSKKYFTFDDISKYDTGIRGALFLFFLAFDVGGLTLVSRYWQISQEQPFVAGVLSLLFFLWGVFNKNGLVALESVRDSKSKTGQGLEKAVH